MVRCSKQSSLVRDCFDRSVVLEGDQREAMVARCCGDNAEVRRDVESLLLAYESAGSFIDSPFGAKQLAHPQLFLQSGDCLGNHKIEALIGSGGCGQVYSALQLKPIQRQVAIKLIKPGMDTAEVLSRFDAERQALAILDHPNIAKVIDAGNTDSGRPYFVMELVRGTSLTEYCDENELSVRDRVELMISICKAVQHAHQKGIIHRDLKPANIPVQTRDGAPEPKIVDFGVAKAIGFQLSDNSLHSALAQMIGTPLYMSPEQAERSPDVDTRSDIYSLGVVLYRLLTGSTTIHSGWARDKSVDEVLRAIRFHEPSRPSVAIQRNCQLPGVHADYDIRWRALSRSSRIDMDWIVMKAIEKDRNRRYRTAMDLAADLEKWLGHQAVEARPPSTSYRFGKTLRRHRIGAAFAATILVILLVATSCSLYQARIALAANRSAAAALAHFVELLGQNSPIKQGQNTRIIDMLDSGMELLGVDREIDPIGKARIYKAYGDSYTHLNMRQKAVSAFAAADELLQPAKVIEQKLYLENRIHLAYNLTLVSELNKLGQAKTLIDQILNEPNLSPDSLDYLDIWTNLVQGKIEFRCGNNSRAIEYLLVAYRNAQAANVPPEDLIYVCSSLSEIYLKTGDHPMGLRYSEQAYLTASKSFNSDSAMTAVSAFQLSMSLVRNGNAKRAIDLLTEFLPRMQALYSKESVRIVVAYYTLGCAYRQVGDLPASLEVLLQGRQIVDNESFQFIGVKRELYIELTKTLISLYDIPGAIETQQMVVDLTPETGGADHAIVKEEVERLNRFKELLAQTGQRDQNAGIGFSPTDPD